MKLYLASDVHLEFGELEVHNKDNADVLILSGDILVAADIGGTSAKHMTYLKFMEDVSRLFKHVIYVVGNHEHYHGDFQTTIGKIREFVQPFSNIHVLDKETFTLDNVTFIGGTLWTDMNKEDPHTLYAIPGVMNDFKIITYGDRATYFRDNDGNSHTRQSRLTPDDVVLDFKAMVDFIKQTVDSNPTGKYVVVGHHAPSKQSTHPRYANEVLINGAYSSDLSEFILDRPQIKLWTHGHTHEKFDYNIGSTRIVANPRGYINYENCADYFDFQLLEI
jgi:Icc-related predicted phosphoesterase